MAQKKPKPTSVDSFILPEEYIETCFPSFSVNTDLIHVNTSNKQTRQNRRSEIELIDIRLTASLLGLPNSLPSLKVHP